jgi:hypothetical protein
MVGADLVATTKVREVDAVPVRTLNKREQRVLPGCCPDRLIRRAYRRTSLPAGQWRRRPSR